MLTYAIEFVQDVQLVCLAIVFACMAWRDRPNTSLRWIAYSYAIVIVGTIIDFSGHTFPLWIRHGLSLEVAPVGYGCFFIGLLRFFKKRSRLKSIPLILVGGTLPFQIYFSGFHTPVPGVALQDFTLGLQTVASTWLLLTARDVRETVLPRRLMAAFLGIYSAVEFSRVVISLYTHRMVGDVAPRMEIVSAMVYVVSASILPLAYIWMMNAKLHADLQRQTLSDALTGVLNRRGLERAGEQAIAIARRAGFNLAIVALDIDRFKQFNDTFGHAGGDRALLETARLLGSHLRQTDTIGRLGGEEFVVLLPGSNTEGTLETVERLRRELEEHVFHIDEKEAHITASFGISFLDGRTSTWKEILREADQALYEAKHAGRNRCVVAPRYNQIAVAGTQGIVRNSSFAAQTSSGAC